MNILPKKRWHVRTKDNIARVRKDEAEAREQEKKRHEKLELAESEARINFLRKKTGRLAEPHKGENGEEPASNTIASDDQSVKGQHVDLFSDYKSHIKTTNKDLEKEQKEEKEKYEKQIGYLTYLGQDTNEALKLRSWYEVAPKRASVGDDIGIMEKDIKNKFTHDPLTLINALLPPEKKINSQPQQKPIKRSLEENETKVSPELLTKRKKLSEELIKHKKNKKIKKHKEKRHEKEKHSKEKKRRRKDKSARELEVQLQKKETLEKLRKERLLREANERARQEALLAPPKETTKEPKAATMPRIVQKYNSQFNPELAKQNMV